MFGGTALEESGSKVRVAPEQVTNYSLAVRKAWVTGPDRAVGRKKGTKLCDRVSVTDTRTSPRRWRGRPTCCATFRDWKAPARAARGQEPLSTPQVMPLAQVGGGWRGCRFWTTMVSRTFLVVGPV